MMEKILVLAPHHDDAEFGMGGYLHRMIRHRTGDPTVIVFGHGSYRRSDGVQVLGADRVRETLAAIRVLGVNKLHLAAGFEENAGDAVAQRDLVALVEAKLDEEQPLDELFVALPSYNQDHRALFDAVMTALRPGRFDAVKRVWAYEYPGNSWGPASPRWGRCYVRLDEQDLEAKIEALTKHASQFDGRAGQHVGPAGAEKLARLRGSESGAAAAELFYLVREIY